MWISQWVAWIEQEQKQKRKLLGFIRVTLYLITEFCLFFFFVDWKSSDWILIDWWTIFKSASGILRNISKCAFLNKLIWIEQKQKQNIKRVWLFESGFISHIQNFGPSESLDWESSKTVMERNVLSSRNYRLSRNKTETRESYSFFKWFQSDYFIT